MFPISSSNDLPSSSMLLPPQSSAKTSATNNPANIVEKTQITPTGLHSPPVSILSQATSPTSTINIDIKPLLKLLDDLTTRLKNKKNKETNSTELEAYLNKTLPRIEALIETLAKMLDSQSSTVHTEQLDQLHTHIAFMLGRIHDIGNVPLFLRLLNLSFPENTSVKAYRDYFCAFDDIDYSKFEDSLKIEDIANLVATLIQKATDKERVIDDVINVVTTLIQKATDKAWMIDKDGKQIYDPSLYYEMISQSNLFFSFIFQDRPEWVFRLLFPRSQFPPPLEPSTASIQDTQLYKLNIKGITENQQKRLNEILIAFYCNSNILPSNPDLKDGWRQAADYLKQAGANLTDSSLILPYASNNFFVFAFPEIDDLCSGVDQEKERVAFFIKEGLSLSIENLKDTLVFIKFCTRIVNNIGKKNLRWRDNNKKNNTLIDNTKHTDRGRRNCNRLRYHVLYLRTINKRITGYYTHPNQVTNCLKKVVSHFFNYAVPKNRSINNIVNNIVEHQRMLCNEWLKAVPELDQVIQEERKKIAKELIAPAHAIDLIMQEVRKKIAEKLSVKQSNSLINEVPQIMQEAYEQITTVLSRPTLEITKLPIYFALQEARESIILKLTQAATQPIIAGVNLAIKETSDKIRELLPSQTQVITQDPHATPNPIWLSEKLPNAVIEIVLDFLFKPLPKAKQLKQPALPAPAKQ